MAMLKRDELSSAPVNTGDLNALLGRGSEFEGKLTFEGTVRIDGIFAGQIYTEDVLIVGEGAVVKAEIECGTVIINGTVQGNIRAKSSVEIHAPGRLKGNVITPAIQIDRGVIFEGSCQMENIEDKLRTKPQPSASPSPLPPPPAKSPTMEPKALPTA